MEPARLQFLYIGATLNSDLKNKGKPVSNSGFVHKASALIQSQ